MIGGTRWRAHALVVLCSACGQPGTHPSDETESDGDSGFLSSGGEELTSEGPAGGSSTEGDPVDDPVSPHTAWCVVPVVRDGILGRVFSSAGDVNGDGREDVVVAAGDQDEQVGYIVFGKDDMADVRLEDVATGVGGYAINPEAGQRNVFSQLAPAGDVNGDGLDDILIGNLNYSTERLVDGLPEFTSQVGRVVVVYGKANTDPIELEDIEGAGGGFQIIGAAGNDQAGTAVGGGVDFNGDGRPDILLGAPNADTPNVEDGGAVYIVPGGHHDAPVDLAGTNPDDILAIWGSDGGSKSGDALAVIDDTNGDGVADLVVGAPRKSNGASAHAGATYVVYGGVTSSFHLGELEVGDSRGYVIDGTGLDQRLGTRVGSAGDVNGDGLVDIAINTRTSTLVLFGGPRRGTVSTKEIESLGFEIVEDAVYEGVGAAQPLGDLDHDGFEEFALAGGGCVFLVWGSADPDPGGISLLMTNPDLGLPVPSCRCRTSTTEIEA